MLSHACCSAVAPQVSAAVLCLRSTCVMIQRGSSWGLWGGLYVDQNGEEDQNLSRGRRLFLQPDRYRKLMLSLALGRAHNECSQFFHSIAAV